MSTEDIAFDSLFGDNTDKLNITDFDIDMNNKTIRTNIVVIGLGATGSAFMILLAQFMKLQSRLTVELWDLDHITDLNKSVSIYGLTYNMGIETAQSKARMCRNILYQLTNMRNQSLGNRANNIINIRTSKATYDTLTRQYKGKEIDFLLVFTDNNESRHEVALYHEANPQTVVIDCRVGSYDQFEVYYSRNPSKYRKTIYYEEDGSPTVHDTYNVCLEDRMNFSIAMASSSFVMNFLVKDTRGQMNTDFKHVMIGNDYIGEVKGYD